MMGGTGIRIYEFWVTSVCMREYEVVRIGLRPCVESTSRRGRIAHRQLIIQYRLLQWANEHL